MAYTTIDNPELYFQTKLYTGNASTNAITLDGSEDMQPDWVWLKSRSFAQNHENYDSVRGATKRLYNNLANAEDTNSTGLTGFNSDGFTLGSSNAINKSGETFASWNWKAGTSFSNDESSTGIGSVDSTGSINTDAGFSIIKVVKNNTTAHTVAHGLGAVPQMIIGKSMTGGSYRWIVYHQAIGNTHAQYLNENFANTDSVTFWNDTTPTSSVFSLGTDNSWNGTNIFYCFAEKKGYSKFGTYEGNGVGSGGGPFIYLGFRPAWFLLKENGSDAWTLMDNKRLGYNKLNHHLFPDNNNDEYASDRIELRSNGVKVIDNDGSINQDGQTYIYMAFAESPFVNSNGIPNNAR